MIKSLADTNTNKADRLYKLASEIEYIMSDVVLYGAPYEIPDIQLVHLERRAEQLLKDIKLYL